MRHHQAAGKGPVREAEKLDPDSSRTDYRDASGVRRWVTCPTRAEAEEAEAKGVLDARQAIQPAVDPKITVGSYAERWLGLIGEAMVLQWG